MASNPTNTVKEDVVTLFRVIESVGEIVAPFVIIASFLALMGRYVL